MAQRAGGRVLACRPGRDRHARPCGEHPCLQRRVARRRTWI